MGKFFIHIKKEKDVRMTCYIVSYDLNEGDPDKYEALIDEIKKFPYFAHITESLWAVVPSAGIGAVEIRDRLKKIIGEKDRLFIIKSGVEAAWRNVVCKNEWLKENL